MGRYVRFDPETEMKIYKLHYGEEKLSQSTLGKRFGVRSERIRDIIKRVSKIVGRKEKGYGKGYCNGRHGGAYVGRGGGSC